MSRPNTRSQLGGEDLPPSTPPSPNMNANVSEEIADAISSGEIDFESRLDKEGTLGTAATLDAEALYVLEVVLAFPKNSHAHAALIGNGILNLADLVVQDISSVGQDVLTYIDENNGQIVHPQLGHVTRVVSFLWYVKWLRHSNTYGSRIPFRRITREQFLEFQELTQTDFVAALSAPGGSAPSSLVATTLGTSRTTTDPVSDFNRGVKRDTSAFLTLREEKQWDNWHRHTLATAQAQNVGDVLDHTYVPQTPSEKKLFSKQQQYMFAIFLNVLKTDEGQSLVRDPKHYGDAQTVFRLLSQYAEKSTKAVHTTEDLMTYLTSFKIDKWTNTTYSFILHWREQVRIYHSLVEDPEDRFSSRMQKRMLQTAVAPNPALNSVESTGNIINQALRQMQSDGTDGVPTSDFEAYVVLLKAAAQTYDRKFTPRSRGARRTNVHSFGQYDEHILDYDISELMTPEAQYDANLHKSQWDQLSKEQRDLWDKFDAQAKAVITGAPPRPPRMPSRPSRAPTRQVNLHNMSAHEFISSYLDEQRVGSEGDVDDSKDNRQETPPSTDTNGETTLVSFAAKSDVIPNVNGTGTSNGQRGDPNLHAGDLRNVLANYTRYDQELNPSSSSSSQYKTNVHRVSIDYNDDITYRVSKHQSSQSAGSLVDRGSNGGIGGEDVRVIEYTGRTVKVTGIDEHQMTGIPIVTAAGVTETQRGSVVVVLPQYAYTGKGKTIHSSLQMEANGQDVNEKSLKIDGGTQRITTTEGYVMPLNIQEGLAYMKLRPYTDDEWKTLPHVFLTSDGEWDPSVLDSNLTDDDEWFDAVSDVPNKRNMMEHPFDEVGEYRHTTDIPEDTDVLEVQNHMFNYHTQVEQHFFDTTSVDKMSIDDIIDYVVLTVKEEKEIESSMDMYRKAYGENIDRRAHGGNEIYVHEHRTNRESITDDKLEALRPFFLWANAEVVKKTLAATTQYGRYPGGDRLQKHYRSINPAVNVSRRNEPVATDTVHSDTPAIDGGETHAQIFIGTETLVADAEGMKTEKQFVNTLQDNIRKRGAMDKLISDRAQVEISERVKDILRSLVIADWQSEPHHQHQNPAERRYKHIKNWTNRTMERTGAPAYTWLLCLMYVCFILNHMATESLGWQTPLQRLTGSTPDISGVLRFHFWQRVYYARVDPGFPSESTERTGRIVGISEHVGNDQCYKVLDDQSKRVIHRSRVRPFDKESAKNLRADTESGEKDPPSPHIKSLADEATGQTTGAGLVMLDPDSLIGRTFLKDVHEEDGTRYRCKIIKAIKDKETELSDDPARKRFLCSVNNDEYEEIVSYNEILEHLEQSADPDGEDAVWKFKRIFAHQGPLTPNDPHWKGSKFNVGVEWETGERTFEPLTITAADDPVTCAIYARDHDLLETDGWKRFKRIVKNEKKLSRMINQAKLRSFRRAPQYMYGIQVPHDHAEAVALDEKNGNTLWQDSEKLELKQLDDYDTFKDKGKYDRNRNSTPSGYKMIRVRMIYAVKHDGRRKSRLVAGGHLTDVPTDSVYSGVVSLRGIRLVIFLAELNGLEIWATDIGNAYLEATTAEKVCIVAGPEFGNLQGHLLIIHKALYGLRSSGLRWHEKFADTLRDMGFFPSKAENDMWMRRNGDIYEYIAVYVDDLAIAAKDPKAIVDILTEKYDYKLKGTGEISFHLGCDFWRDEEGVLCFAPKKYIKKMVDTYERLFGSKPTTNVRSPLEKGDHPEVDTTDYLDADGIKKYQSLIGALQWAVSIGRLDITTAVMTMSGFRVAPRKGHLERLKRIYAYLARFCHATIRVRTNEPDYSSIPEKTYDWQYSVYGSVKEVMPRNAPEPLGKWVTVTTYVDANLYHDLITGRSVTGILILINQTVIDWYSKKQATVETATYGSEFVAARIATDKTIDMRTTLRYLGVPVREKSFMFGDNKSVVGSATVPHSKLAKRHNALSFHRVREAIASGIIRFHHIPGESNPADILSKHWGYAAVWQLLKPLMFWNKDNNKAEPGG